jgi:heptosyltransferase-2
VSALARLLVRLANPLGDALMARPLLHAIHAAHPAAEIRLVGPAGPLAALAQDQTWATSLELAARGPALAALAGELRRWRAEAALVLPPSFSSAWFVWRAGARRRIGYSSEGRDALLTEALARPARGDLHVSEEYLELGGRLGARGVPVPILPVADAARDAARRLLAGGGLAGPYAILAPGATYGPAKRWPVERFAEAGERLRGRGLELVVAGSAGDREVCAALHARLGGAALDLAGRTDIGVAGALCAMARLVVCNDSGLAHLAAAVGAATIAIFGSTSSAWTAPLGPRVKVVQRPPVCAPCFRRTCAIGYRCLDAVTVDAVDRAGRELAA